VYKTIENCTDRTRKHTMPAGKRTKNVAKVKQGAMAKATLMAQRQSVALQSKASKKTKPKASEEEEDLDEQLAKPKSGEE
jgi:hypothetical protein